MTTTSQCPEPQQLKSLMLGSIAEADAQTLRLHLKECDYCSTLAAQLATDPSGTDRLDQLAVHGQEAKETSSVPPTALPTPNGMASNGSNSNPLLSPAVEPDEIGRLGPYRVLRLLGRGGMGVVYQAEDTSLGRPVAIKVLKEELADHGDHWERFLREARTLASIKHEHVVTVYHSGQERKIAYLVMELLKGCSLAEHLANVSQPSLADILRLGRELATGLAAVHEHGLIHRDMKPANVWVEAPSGRIKILDFGLARLADEGDRLTQTGVVVGTPAYMSPEQARGVEVTQRSDLFSLGCILYRLSTGVEPFTGPDTMSLLMALAVDIPRPAEDLNPAIPRALSDLVMHLLAKKPEDRPATAKDVVARLEAIERSQGKKGAWKHAADVAPVKTAAGATPVADAPHNGGGLRVGWLVAAGLLMGVVGGFFALQTPAEPTKPVKDKPMPVVESRTEAPVVDDPDWQKQQRNQAAAPSSQDVPKPVAVPKPIEPKPVEAPKLTAEYLADWRPLEIIGWPPEIPAVTAPKPVTNPDPPPFQPPPPPPKGPRGGSPRGGPPPGGGPNGPRPEPPQNNPAPATEVVTYSLTFPTLSVNGITAAHGIGMHASPKGKVGMSFALNGRFDTFTTEVALNDTSNRSPVGLTFSVYGDNELLWRSTPVTTRSQTQQSGKVPVKGVKVLLLTVTNVAGDPQSVMKAHSLWVDPQVIRRK